MCHSMRLTKPHEEGYRVINKHSRKAYIDQNLLMLKMANRHPRNCKKMTKEEISESINDGLSDVSSLESQAEIDSVKNCLSSLY